MKVQLIFLCFSFINTLSFGQVSASDSTRKINFEGYVDLYYQYNFNQPADLKNSGRVFDTDHNNITISLIQAKISYQHKKYEAVVDLLFGPNADLANFGNANSSRFIKQAYLTYQLSPRLSVTAGQYSTHIGYEVVDAPQNFNYSLSYLFGTGPFYQTGIKADYQVNDRLSIMGGIINGWDQLSDFNDKKSLTAQIGLVPHDHVQIYFNWIGGDEYNGMSGFGDLKGSYTNLFDLVAQFQPHPKLHFGLNGAVGLFNTAYNAEVPELAFSHDAKWYGLSGYADYAFSDIFSLGLRTEYFKDKEGIRYYGPIEMRAFTLTGNIKAYQNLLYIKPEIRWDHETDYFIERTGIPTDDQVTVGLALIGKF